MLRDHQKSPVGTRYKGNLIGFLQLFIITGIQKHTLINN